MLETVDTKKKIDKAEYKEWLPRLKTDLRELQYRLREVNRPLIVVFEGWDTAGKGDSIKHLTEALDPRGFKVNLTGIPSEQDRRRPWLHRYIVGLPPRGKISFYERSWYTRVLQERVDGNIPKGAWSRAYQEISQLEEMLAHDGAIIVKMWLHITKKQQRHSLKAAEKDPFRKYTVTDAEWRRHELYGEYEQAAEEMLERTSTHLAPWRIVEAKDKRYRRMRVLQIVCEEIVNGINRTEARATCGDAPGRTERFSVPVLEEMPTVLDEVDLSKKLERAEYKKRLRAAQIRLRELQVELIQRETSACVVYEGWDAAGKGGSIRRLVATLDPRHYQVVPIGKPTPEELAHHYLWRFWIHAPRRGSIVIFDRSWYGRVLVERVEDLCSVEDWRRAYQEINEFEMALYRSGSAIIKFWLHITPEEQLRRFEAREKDPHRRWKLTDEDWRNREKWGQYRDAVDEMVRRTSTTYAPWTIVEGDDKYWARVKAVETVCDAVSARLDLAGKGDGK